MRQESTDCLDRIPDPVEVKCRIARNRQEADVLRRLLATAERWYSYRSRDSEDVVGHRQQEVTV